MSYSTPINSNQRLTMAHVIDRIVEESDGLWRLETRNADDNTDPDCWHILARWLSRHEADLLLKRRAAQRLERGDL